MEIIPSRNVSTREDVIYRNNCNMRYTVIRAKKIIAVQKRERIFPSGGEMAKRRWYFI